MDVTPAGAAPATPPPRNLPYGADIYGVALLDVQPAVAVETMPREWPPEHRGLLHDFAAGVAFAIDEASEVWRSAMRDIPAPVRIRVEVDPDARNLGPRLSLARAVLRPHSSGTGQVAEVVLVVRPEPLWQLGLESTEAIKELVATVIADAIERLGASRAAAQALANAMSSGPPTFAVHQYSPLQARPTLPSPVSIDEAALTTADRRLATSLRDRRVETGIFRGLVARDLESGVIAPIALGLLEEALAPYSVAEVLSTGLEQLERAAAKSANDRRSLRHAVGSTPLRYNPVDRWQELERRALTLRRAIATVLEVALRTQPTGSRSLDRITWSETLAAADVYVASTLRSERLHHQLAPLMISVSDMYEIELDLDDQPFDPAPDAANPAAARARYDLDFEALERARATEGMPPLYGTGPDPIEEPVDERGSADRSAFEGTEGICAAMHDAYGADVLNLMTTLLCFAAWPLAEAASFVNVSRDEAVSYLVQNTETLDEPRARAVIELLALRPAALRADTWRPWEARRRSARLETRPLLSSDNGESIFVLPHWCEGCAAIYARYLGQGLLPWPEASIDERVKRALADYRDDRNRELEDDVVRDLQRLGFQVRPRLRQEDAHVVGLPTLSGEIDVLAVADAPVLWVIEVKDPAEVFTISEVRRSLDRFMAHDGWVPKLESKTIDVRSNPNSVAAAVAGRTVAIRDVRPLMVTRRVVPAAFAPSGVPFTTLERLARFLES